MKTIISYKKKIKLTKLQKERANRIVAIFNCLKLEPETCLICSDVEKLVSKTRKK